MKSTHELMACTMGALGAGICLIALSGSAAFADPAGSICTCQIQSPEMKGCASGKLMCSGQNSQLGCTTFPPHKYHIENFPSGCIPTTELKLCKMPNRDCYAIAVCEWDEARMPKCFEKPDQTFDYTSELKPVTGDCPPDSKCVGGQPPK